MLGFPAYINEMHGSRSKIPNIKPRPYIYDVKFLASLGAVHIYDTSRLRVKTANSRTRTQHNTQKENSQL
jgi:hypothetical protein